MNAILITLGILSITVYMWSTISIYTFLENRDEKMQSFIFINFFIFRYIKNYKKITENESGKVCYLYYLWLFTINLALLCFVLLMAWK
jgi:hypothetical protein